MPDYCYLRADLRCPHCESVVTDLVWFQWGFSPGQLPQEEHLYRIGDPIRWRFCEKAKGIFSWAYFYGEDRRDEGANFGDPEIRDLAFHYSFDSPGGRPCGSCGQPLGGTAVEIRDNVIRRAWVYLPGEFDDEADIYLIRDGGLTSMPEWQDHSMPSVHGHSRWRLVTPYVENGFLLTPPEQPAEPR